MAYKFDLPKNKEQREEVLAKIILEGRGLRNIWSVRWWLAALYMMGVRDFSNINYQTGTISTSYMDEAGILKFRYEEIMAKYVAQLGRLYSLDISPAIRRKGVSLDGMRKASVGQVVLDAALSEDKIESFKLSLIPPLLMYGTVGVGIWYEGEDEQGLELIPPWQLYPIPVSISGPNDVRGLMRVRPVPVEWIKNLAGTPNKKSNVYKGVDDVQVPSGHMPIDLDTMGEGLISMTSAGAGFFIRADKEKDFDMATGRGKKKDEKMVPITNLVEMWLETSDGYLAEYGIYIGMSKLRELKLYDHTEHKYPMPVRIIRDTTVASFWGRSYVDQLIPLNNEAEVALSSLFQTASDYDLYGVMMFPGTMGVPPEAERGQDGIKKIRWEPDYTCPDLKPFNIEPAKLTKPQLDAATIASTLMDKIANQPAKMISGEAPGRVDSAAALGYLGEMSSIPISPIAKNIADGMSGVYRAMLRILKDRWTDQKVVDITSLDDSLAGIILDAESGQMHLSQNAIPFPDEVSITISSEVPISRELQKIELKEALKEQRITLDEFNIQVRKRGLDIPVGNELGWQNYRRAMLENIVLFGDGETPGKVVVSPHDSHKIHGDVLAAFMARPEFYLASNAVIDAFEEHYQEHYAGQGGFPDQLPYPEESAEMMMGPGMMPPQGGVPTGNIPI